LIEKYLHAGCKTEAARSDDYFVKSILDNLRKEPDSSVDFFATLELKFPGAARRAPEVILDGG
jgi:hypothetical protein